MKSSSNLWPAATVALAIVVSAAVAGAGAATASRATAGQVQIVLIGHHETVPVSEHFPIGISHRGTFAATGAFCAAGTAVDVDMGVAAGTGVQREYTCDDGSGSLTLSVNPGDQTEHLGSGVWRVVRGTGRYAELHGAGTYRAELVSGDATNLMDAVFRLTETGFVDADAVPPTLSISAANATKVKRPAGTYTVRVSLALRDNVDGNAVAYTIKLLNGRKPLTTSSGTSTSGSAAATLQVKTPAPRLRSVQLVVTASDPVGNETTLTRVINLPR